MHSKGNRIKDVIVTFVEIQLVKTAYMNRLRITGVLDGQAKRVGIHVSTSPLQRNCA
jgi:hypothetical protein